MTQGVCVRGLGGNYTPSKLRKKIKHLRHTLEIAENYLKVMEKEKPLKA